MRIQYISDIHLEFLSRLLKEKRFSPCADILCLAGDIGYPSKPIYTQFLKHVSSSYNKVFLITGNHEYYTCKSMEDVHGQIQRIIIDHQLTNVSFLDNSYEDYEGVRFVGSTLWSRIPAAPKVLINDFHTIPGMTIELYNELHTVACEFLQSSVVVDSPLPVVVMTHHLPSMDLIDEKYKTYVDYNPFFASDCSELLKDPMKIWISGHTHTGYDKTIRGVHCVCNPVGYPSENPTGEFNRVVELR
jgi:predicted phosphodiesterase